MTEYHARWKHQTRARPFITTRSTPPRKASAAAAPTNVEASGSKKPPSRQILGLWLRVKLALIGQKSKLAEVARYGLSR
jgi:hypothetical protein